MGPTSLGYVLRTNEAVCTLAESLRRAPLSLEELARHGRGSFEFRMRKLACTYLETAIRNAADYARPIVL